MTNQPQTKRALLLALAALAGAICYLSFPPADMGMLAWIGLVPLFYALACCSSPGEGALVGLVYGTVFFALLMQYILMFGLLPWIMLAIFQGLFFAIFGWAATSLRRVSSILLWAAGMASGWVLVEYLRSHLGPLSFTFGSLTYSQHTMLPILQVASLLGASAITFLIVLSNALLAGILVHMRMLTAPPTDRQHPRMLASVIAGYAIIGIVYMGGTVALSLRDCYPPTGQPLQVALVQGNVDLHTPLTPEDAQRCREVYSELTPPISARLDLVVWPETALPVVLNLDSVYWDTVTQLARDRQITLLTGALEETGDGELYNSAYLFDADGELVSKYRKIHLVMFGEYVPWRDRLKFLERYPIRRFDFVPGDQQKLMSVSEVPFGVLICFEAIFSEPTRQLCRRGAQFLAFLTSDVWAAGTSEVLQHSYTAPVRAVEARKYVLRAATMGQSAIISPYGDIMKEIPVATANFAEGEIYPRAGLSVYHHIGDLPLLAICAVLWLAAIVAGRLRADQ